jgi:hypothetical protein
MKHYALVLAAALLLFAGCSEPKKGRTATSSSSSSLKTKTVEFKKVTPLLEGERYDFVMEMKIEWPERGGSTKALKNIQKGITGLLFGNSLETTDLEHAMKAYNDRSAEFYIEDNIELVTETDEDWGFMLTWEESIKGNFLKEYNGMISYVSLVYGYSGGAHGMSTKSARTFFLNDGDTVSVDDLFKRGYEEQLTKALRKNLPLCVEDMEMLFETEIYPSETFYVTAAGLTYVYQPYEIGSYALGIVEITIPWKEIKDILK